MFLLIDSETVVWKVTTASQEETEEGERCSGDAGTVPGASAGPGPQCPTPARPGLDMPGGEPGAWGPSSASRQAGRSGLSSA